MMGRPQYSTISNTPLFHSYCAALLRDMLLELFAILFDKRRRRHRRGVAKGTDRIAHDVAADVENQIQIALSPSPCSMR